MFDDGFTAGAGCYCPLCQSYAFGAGGGADPQSITRQAVSTGDYRIDALVYPDLDRWNSLAAVGTAAPVTYSFLGAANSSGDDVGFAPLNDTQIAGARAAFATWEATTNIKFVEVSSGGDIAIGTNYQTGSSAYAYSPGTTYGGDIYLSNATSTNLDMSAGSFGFLTFIHEIGHAIGLKHPGDYNGSSGSGIPPYLPSAEDSFDNTVMSYNGFSYPSAPQSYDVLAIQYLYGAKGSSGISYGQTGDVLLTTGSSGADSLIGINLNDRLSGGDGGDTIFGQTGDDTIYGNVGTDRLSGASGNDVLFGGRDADVVYGGTGNDAAYGNLADDIVYGEAGNDVLYGGQGNDTLSGGSGNDTLFGNLGDDSMIGGSGANKFVINSGNDTIGDFSFSLGDRIRVATGTTITATSASDGAIVSFSNSSATVKLIGISASSVSSGFLEFF